MALTIEQMATQMGLTQEDIMKALLSSLGAQSQKTESAPPPPQPQEPTLVKRITENHYKNGAVHDEPITYGGGKIRYETRIKMPAPTSSLVGGYAAAPGNLEASWAAFMHGLMTKEEGESYIFEMEKRMEKRFSQMPGQGQTVGAYSSCASPQTLRAVRAGR